MNKDAWLYAIALAVGAAVWVVVSLSTGRSEAWDSAAYFSLGVPSVCVASALLGVVQPFRSWRWGVTPLIGQLAALLVTQGVGNLLPLGVIVFAVLAVPSVLTARAGAFIRRNWLTRQPTNET
jgi:hypothetical protein